MKLSLVTLLASLACAGPVAAQSINVDIDRASGTGVGIPTAGYAGAGGQGGSWNSVFAGSSGTIIGLVSPSGAASGLTVTRDGTGATGSSAGGSADFNKLMSDWDDVSGLGSSVSYTLNNLGAGLYRVTVYASLSGDGAYWTDGFGFDNYYSSGIGLHLDGNVSSFEYAFVTGPATPGVFKRGVTHATFPIKLAAGTHTLEMRSSCGFSNHEKTCINGFQVVQYTETRLYVDKNATGVNSGKTWADAFTNLQDALELAAESSGQIDEIWVADGTYYPGVSASASFVIPSTVAVYGGFAGGEATLSARDWKAHPTILSGNPMNTPTLADDCYHVIEASNTSTSTRVDGFTIEHGQATGTGTDTKGPLVYMDAGNTRFWNCKLQYGQALADGGLIFMTNNSAPVFGNCSFYDGYTLGRGGAIACDGASHFSAVNCFFGFNGSDLEGGAISTSSESTNLTQCIFSNNFSGGHGGAVFARVFNTLVTMKGCTVAYNDAGDFDTVSKTGGVYTAEDAAVSIHNSILYGNTDNSPATNGQGGQYFRAGIVEFDLKSCLIQGWNGISPGVDCFDGHPLFVDPAGADNSSGTIDDDFTPGLDSPCIDRADPSLIPNDSFDLDGDLFAFELIPFDANMNGRFFDNPAVVEFKGSTADLGAVESHSVPVPPCRVDIDLSGSVDSGDYLAFLLAFAGGDLLADFDNSGDLDSADYLQFLLDFAAGC